MSPVYKLSANSVRNGRTVYGSMLAGNTAYVEPILAYESIATVTVGSGGSSSIEFTSIPNTYKHLEIRGILRDNRSIGSNIFWSDLLVQCGNGSIDTGNNYSMHRLYADGSSVGSGAQTTYSSIAWWDCVPNTQYIAANIFNGTIITILDYANTNKYKTFRGIMGWEANTVQSKMQMGSGLWMNTSAITNIKIATSATLQQYSQLALYGIKGA